MTRIRPLLVASLRHLGLWPLPRADWHGYEGFVRGLVAGGLERIGVRVERHVDTSGPVPVVTERCGTCGAVHRHATAWDGYCQPHCRELGEMGAVLG